MSTPDPPSPTASASKDARRQLLRRAAWLAVAAVVVIAAFVAAASSRPPSTEAERAYELKQHTLCPVCDGQSVLESNAPAAAAMRRQIDLWVDEGRSDTQIRADLAAVYGDDVNALPPGEGVGILVWALPVAAFAVAAAGLWAATRRWRAQAADAETEELSHRRWVPSTVVTVGALVIVGAMAGVLVARSAGLRLGGETISGDIDRSARSLLVDAQRQFAANRLDEARATLGEISRLDRDLRGALVLSARLHLRECETLAAQAASEAPVGADADSAGAQTCDPTAALTDLDRVLADNPADTEALALRGWLLVRIPDAGLIAAGIASLDAAVALEPGEFDPWVFRGYAARFIEGDFDAAIGYYGAALERGPPPAMAAALQSAIAEMRADLR